MSCQMKEGGGGEASVQEEEKAGETNISEPCTVLDTTWALSYPLLISSHSSKHS